MTFFQDVNIAARDSASIDAFARMRVSNPETIFDSKQISSNGPLLWDDQLVSGSGGSSAWSQDTASTVLSVPATTACKRVRQTFMRMPYKPGKSQLIFMTGTLASGGGTGITRGMGAYDDDNGIFALDDQGTLKFVVRSSTSGSPVDTAVAQTSWNLDTLDGSGPSGITLDPDQSQIVIIDYEWLGVGRVRCGFVVNGIPIYAHEFNHSNLAAGVYMSSPNLPLRYEISNSGAGAASSVECICASVISEGGQPSTGIDKFWSTGSSIINANTAGTKYAVFGIRLKSTKLDATVIANSVSAMNITSDDYIWELILNPTIASTAPTWSSASSDPYEYANGDTSGNPSVNTVTGGTVLAGGYVKAGSDSGGANIGVDTQLRVGSSIAGTADQLWLVLTPLSANADFYGGMTVREVT